MKKSRRKRIVRRRRRISEKEIMRIKRKLKKSARKLRLGAKRTGAYVYGTLRRIRGNPATSMSDIYRISEKINSEGGRVRVEQAGGGGLNLYVDRISPYDDRIIDKGYEYLLRGTKKEVYEALIRIRFVDKYRPYATQIPLRTARSMVRAGLPLRRSELRGNPPQRDFDNDIEFQTKFVTQIIFEALMALKGSRRNEEMIEDVAVIPRPKHPGDFVVRVKHRYYVDGRRVYSAGLKTEQRIEQAGVPGGLAIIGWKQKRVGNSDYVYNFYGVRMLGVKRPRKGSLFDNRIR